MDASERKQRLRAELTARRARRPLAERAQVARDLATRARPLCADASAVAAYASHGSEPGTGPLRAALLAAGATVLLPVVRGAELAWVVDDGADHVPGGERGMPEPTGPEVGRGAAGLVAAGVRLLLVPALAVRPDGVRLGKGGGYYDRLLETLPPHPEGPLRVVVVHDDEVLPDLPAEPHDLAARVDRVLTPRRLLPVRPQGAG